MARRASHWIIILVGTMESVMSASPTLQFEIPNEMRAVAERSVEQAKAAFQQFCKRLRKPFPR